MQSICNPTKNIYQLNHIVIIPISSSISIEGTVIKNYGDKLLVSYQILNPAFVLDNTKEQKITFWQTIKWQEVQNTPFNLFPLTDLKHFGNLSSTPVAIKNHGFSYRYGEGITVDPENDPRFSVSTLDDSKCKYLVLSGLIVGLQGVEFDLETETSKLWSVRNSSKVHSNKQ